MPRAGVVRAHGHAQRPVVALAQAHRHRQPGRVAVGGDHEPAPEPVLGASLPPAVSCADDADDAAGAVVQHRAGDVDALLRPGARLLGVPGQQSGRSRAGCGPGRSPGSWTGRASRSSIRPPPPMIRRPLLRSQPSLCPASDAHRGQGLDRARGQPVAADLLAREPALLQHQHVQPGAGQVVRRRRPGRAGADDDDVGCVGAGYAGAGYAGAGLRRRCYAGAGTLRGPAAIAWGQVRRADGGILLGHGPVQAVLHTASCERLHKAVGRSLVRHHAPRSGRPRASAGGPHEVIRRTGWRHPHDRDRFPAAGCGETVTIMVAAIPARPESTIRPGPYQAQCGQ